MGKPITKEELSKMLDGRIELKKYEDVPARSTENEHVVIVEVTMECRLLFKGKSVEEMEELLGVEQPASLIKLSDAVEVCSSMCIESSKLLDEYGEEAHHELWD